MRPGTLLLTRLSLAFDPTADHTSGLATNSIILVWLISSLVERLGEGNGALTGVNIDLV